MREKEGKSRQDTFQQELDLSTRDVIGQDYKNGIMYVRNFVERPPGYVNENRAIYR